MQGTANGRGTRGRRSKTAAVLAAVFLAAFPSPAPSAQSRGPSCGESAKPANFDVVLSDMRGVKVRFADYRGQVIVVHFWATWCVTCKPEMVALEALQKAYASRGLTVLAVSVDDPPEKIQSFAKELRITFPLLVGLGRNDVMQDYGPLFGVPTTAIVSRDGRICIKLRGLSTKETLEKSIAALL